VVQAVLGHASASMTMDVYGHLLAGNLWAAADRIGGVGGTPGAPAPKRAVNDEGPGRGVGL
jgi:hypothetical protein